MNTFCMAMLLCSLRDGGPVISPFSRSAETTRHEAHRDARAPAA